MSTLLDLIYPRCCSGCGEGMGEQPGHLCGDCLSASYLIRLPYCSVCGEPVSGRVDHVYTCFQCSIARPAFEQARAAARYDGPVREAIHAFKYRQAIWLQHDLVQLLRALLLVDTDTEAIDAIIPVPLHKMKRRQRGFNQSSMLAKGLSREINRPLLLKNLRRIRYTVTQTSLSANARLNNVRGAFAVSGDLELIEGKRILLVDDVMTTGATLSECARVLKQAGAEAVMAVAVARG